MDTDSIPSLEDAIRQVFLDGTARDYCDVVREVKKRFGLHVAEGDVERLYLDWKHDRASTRAETLAQVDVEPVRSRSSSGGARDPRPTADAQAAALHFVKAVGGVASARAALDELEHTLQSLRD